MTINDITDKWAILHTDQQAQIFLNNLLLILMDLLNLTCCQLKQMIASVQHWEEFKNRKLVKSVKHFIAIWKCQFCKVSAHEDKLPICQAKKCLERYQLLFQK